METPRTRAPIILKLAALYNISGGLAILFLLDWLAPLIGFAPLGNMLFRLFVGGTAVTFGLAYYHLSRRSSPRDPLLYFGTGLKYWAFIAALVSYLFYDLSLSIMVLFGVANLAFALLFTYILLTESRNTSMR